MPPSLQFLFYISVYLNKSLVHLLERETLYFQSHGHTHLLCPCSLSKPLTFPSMTRGHPWIPLFVLKNVVYYFVTFEKNCMPRVKENAEQKISPRATLSEAKLELKRIIFCGSILFYKCTTILFSGSPVNNKRTLLFGLAVCYSNNYDRH
jgi:hypothetical protein